jgi:6-phosphogluconolactonase/glucosamine-6-phosphate isomerase/deaminase
MESQNLYEVMIERYGRASTIMTSARHVDERMGPFDDPRPTRSSTASRTMLT